MGIKTIFSKRWLFTNLVVLLALVVLIRLGVWQLDRLEQRRHFNARIFEQVDAPKLELTSDNLSTELYDMEYRDISVQGTYLFEDQIALRNQYTNNQVGVHLITPLVIPGSENIAIMVDRGWIPQEHADRENWYKYDEAAEVIIFGKIRRSQTIPQLNMLPDPTLTPEQTGLDTWSQVNLERISQQVPFELLDVFVQQSPAEGIPDLPTRSVAELELDEGPHMGYALQWFSFALILLMGYPFYIKSQEEKNE